MIVGSTFGKRGLTKKSLFVDTAAKEQLGYAIDSSKLSKKNADNKWHRTSKKFVALLCSKCNYSENNSIFNGDENDIVTVDFLN